MNLVVAKDSGQAMKPKPGFEDWTAVTSKYAAGGNLLQDLSFSCYYHSTNCNRIAHIIFTFACVHLVFVALAASTKSMPLAGLVVWAPGAIFMMLRWPPWQVGFSLLAWHVSAALLAPRFAALLPAQLVPWLLPLTAVLLLAMFLGHVVGEGSLPAFRPVEAFLTTPFFLVLTLFFKLGYNPRLCAEIERLSQQWNGSERRTFNFGKHRKNQ